MHKKKQIYLLIFLVIVLVGVNYRFVDDLLIKSFEENSGSEFGIVERVIDGDTVVIEGESVRLLGINSPERGENYYEEAKEFLERIVLNKTVELKFGKDKIDRYGRKLAYIFLIGENVNLELVDEGLANFYFPSGKDSYYGEALINWEHCLENGKYLCEKSEEKCIVLKEFDYRGEVIILENVCARDIGLKNWEIKDEGRKRFVFESFVLEGGEKVKIITGEGIDNQEKLYWSGKNYVWTNTGDTLFLRDSYEKLVLWESY
jgi:hypothetical protein